MPSKKVVKQSYKPLKIYSLLVHIFVWAWKALTVAVEGSKKSQFFPIFQVILRKTFLDQQQNYMHVKYCKNLKWKKSYNF